jgi:transposase
MPKKVNYDMEYIVRLLDESMSWLQINKIHGKSAKTIERWMQRRGIRIGIQPAKHFVIYGKSAL